MIASLVGQMFILNVLVSQLTLWGILFYPFVALFNPWHDEVVNWFRLAKHVVSVCISNKWFIELGTAINNNILVVHEQSRFLQNNFG